MNDNEKMINLINLIDKTLEDVVCDCEIDCDCFCDELKKIFPSVDDLNSNILNMIIKLNDRNIFDYYDGEKSKNNEIRKYISTYINKNSNLYFDYELVKRNINDNYNLYNYLKEEDKNNIDKVENLIKINPKVILLLDIKLLTKEFVIKHMQEDKFISFVFAGHYGKDNNLYRYSNFYKDDIVDNLLYEHLKDDLKEDAFKYINYSELIRNNIELSKIVLKENPKFIYYIGEDIKDNIEILEVIE